MNEKIEKRYLNLKDARVYLGLSPDAVRKFCESIGAAHRLSGVDRIVFDKQKIDEYFESQVEPVTE